MTTTTALNATAPQPASVDVQGLDVWFGSGDRRTHVVKSASFSVAHGQSVAIVGESGSGKSVTARSLVGLVGTGATVSAKHLHIGGTDASALAEKDWRQIRGRQIGFVLQDALSSLDPFRTIGQEITEALTTHRVVADDEVGDRVLALLASVGIPDPHTRRDQYPHQLSGGLRQRALIASALAAEPDLLIADEPTTALDVTVQAQILRLLEERKAQGTALLLISHDLAVVSRIADYLYVMKDGQFVEEGPTREVLDDPSHAYTRQLLDAVPAAHARGTRLSASSSPAVPGSQQRVGGDEVVLSASHLRKRFQLPDRSELIAVDDVSLELRAGQTLGIVGESGSGKSTVARLLLALDSPDEGTVEIEGKPWTSLGRAETRRQRQRIQVVYQDPLGSFDPRYTVGRIIEEPLIASRLGSRTERRDRVRELLDLVGLDASLASRRPRHLSGGQRQRVAIARALATRPDIIVCDEPVSALDVSIQAQVLDLLADIQDELGVSYVFISHHLGVIYHVSDHVLVMKDGRAVESGTVDEIFDDPQHPYTRELLAAIPTIEKPEAVAAARRIEVTA
jgi:peptide/nickel transport system ATP-binding protein